MLALFVLRFAEERGFAADLGEDLNEVHFKKEKEKKRSQRGPIILFEVIFAD